MAEIANRDTKAATITALGTTTLMETEFIGYELDWKDATMGLLPMDNFFIYADGYFTPPVDGNYLYLKFCS